MNLDNLEAHSDLLIAAAAGVGAWYFKRNLIWVIGASLLAYGITRFAIRDTGVIR